MQAVTPMLRQYLEIKNQHPGTILFFRLGDFYEMFNEDAVLASRELEITLTARQKDSANPVPMCGVPHHAASGYIAKLVRKGYRVAICEQAQEPGEGSKLVRREVVRVITPGTVVDSQILDSSDSVFLAALVAVGQECAAALLEVSTGDFRVVCESGDGALDRIRSTLDSFSPRELLFPKSMAPVVSTLFGVSNPEAVDRSDTTPQAVALTTTPLDDADFQPGPCRETLEGHLGVRELTAFGIEEMPVAVSAAGACLRYAKETQRASVAHVDGIRLMRSADHLVLDDVTMRNLEIVEARSAGGAKSLFAILNKTKTAMGGRLLKGWLARPSVSRTEIEARHQALEKLSEARVLESLGTTLGAVYDLERLVGRLNLGTASARDLLALGRTLDQVPSIKAALSMNQSTLLNVVNESLHELGDVRELIARAIAEEPPINFADGGTIRRGFNQELDELRALSTDAKGVIASFEETERERTGIPSLKVRFNNVFGYFIEVSKSNLARVPDDYERKQTLANAERYTTVKLKEWEQKVLSADDRMLRLETEIFQSVRSQVRDETSRLMGTARALATLDALRSLAEVAVERDYLQPELHDGDELSIKAGRHPVVEAFLGNSFVPNDVLLNNTSDRLLLITGPNMGGKSTILRQVALIQVMAQAGSFVPARFARLPLVDRIWTRVGASDDLSSGRSTFMVEMTETAAILHNATPKSLILLDEIGRGTSTFDGLSIAWAVAEYVHDSGSHSAKTLFATHYHELTELAEHLPGAKNYRVTATQEGGDVVFLHKLEPGKASDSYGIAVARLAGMPKDVLDRAAEVLKRLEQYELAILGTEAGGADAGPASRRSGAARIAAQMSLFAAANEQALDKLRNVDPEEMTDTEAKEFLRDLRAKLV